MLKKFWSWYDRHLTLNMGIASGLFILQLIHLYWLTTHVVFLKAFGQSFFNPPPFWQWIIVIVDYTEIPALIATSLVYINAHRKKASFKNLLYLFFLNVQLVHIFWITDEFVVEKFSGTGGTILPNWLAWVAILIDYLELPVIYETMKNFLLNIKSGDFKKAAQSLKKNNGI